MNKEGKQHMKVVILGVTGRVGSRLSTELLQRGCEVSGIARHVDENVQNHPNLKLIKADVHDLIALPEHLRGHDVVISSTRFSDGSDAPGLIAAIKAAGVDRLMVVGGAGSLLLAPDVVLLNTPEFPEAYKKEAIAGQVFLQALQQEQVLDWTFLSPSALFEPGERTGKFKLGEDSLLVDADGKSWISMEDFAIAFVDELFSPKHSRRRFTVGY